MSLDNIQLPASIIQNLYNKPLYDLKTDKSGLTVTQTGSIVFLGSNQKKIAIIVEDTANIYLAEDELNFLLGILTACKLTMADIALINISKNKGLNYNTVTAQLKAEKIFLFGLDNDILSLPLQFPHYQVQQFNNQVYLSSAALSDLQKMKDEKMKLWSCLKKIFSL